MFDGTVLVYWTGTGTDKPVEGAIVQVGEGRTLLASGEVESFCFTTQREVSSSPFGLPSRRLRTRTKFAASLFCRGHATPIFLSMTGPSKSS
jgi:hypothetical protein